MGKMKIIVKRDKMIIRVEFFRALKIGKDEIKSVNVIKDIGEYMNKLEDSTIYLGTWMARFSAQKVWVYSNKLINTYIYSGKGGVEIEFKVPEDSSGLGARIGKWLTNSAGLRFIYVITSKNPNRLSEVLKLIKG